jgi:putative phage-type endonuclease
MLNQPAVTTSLINTDQVDFLLSAFKKHKMEETVISENFLSQKQKQQRVSYTAEKHTAIVERLLTITKNAPLQRSEEWIKQRDRYITATGVSAILGQNKYQSKEAYIRERLAKVKFTGNMYTAHGVKYEPVAAQLYQKRNGGELIELGLIEHPKYSFLAASPDRLVIGEKGDLHLIEIKCPYSRKPNNLVPAEYYPQIQLQLGCCELTNAVYVDTKITEKPYERIDSDSRTWGLTKGIILRSMNKPEKVLYPPLCDSKEDYLTWIRNNSEKESKKEKWEIICWVVDMISEIPVSYEHELFESWIPELKDAWKEINSINSQN